MFLEYASAFDYTEDFHYSAEQSGKPITWEQAKKQNDEYMKSMENWSLKDFQEHLGGELTITLLKNIGVGFEVHEIDTSLVQESILWLKERQK